MSDSKDLEQAETMGSRAVKALPVISAEQRRDRERSAYGAWDVSSEDPVDAEVVDEPDGQSDAGWRERLRDRARGLFGADSREHMDDREKIHFIDLDREASDPDGSEPRENLLKLRSESRLASERYMQSLRDSHLLVPGFSDDERMGQVDAMHRVYMQMMMQSCLKPLSKGINTRSVVQAAGMYLTMRMLSKDFRSEVGELLQPLKDQVQQRIDRRTRSMGAWADEKADKRNTMLTGGKSVDRGAFLSKKWQRRLDDLERRDRGNRELYTPESAALTEVGLMENAFWKMREPGADAKQIDTSYRAMRKRLHDQMAEDGLDRSDVMTRARTIIGERMEYEPEMRTMFLGVAHGRIVKSGPHEERIAGTDRVREVWTGEFEDQLGRPLPEGMFILREPMDEAAHQVQLGESMKASLMDAFDGADHPAVAANLLGYVGGFGIHGRNLDISGVHPTIQARMKESETMLATMAIDGLPDDDRRRVFSNAFVDAMESVKERHPEADAQLMQMLGGDWQERMAEAFNDPERLVEVLRDSHQRDHAREQASRADHEQPAPEQHADDFQPA